MKQSMTWLQNIFTLRVLSFFIGLITAILAQALLDRIIPVTLGLVLVLTTVFVLLSIGTLIKLRDTVLPQFKLTALPYRAGKHLGEKSLYDALIERINLAQSSLLYLSSYRPGTMKSSQDRIRYYDAINKLLDRYHRQGRDFKYERILQIKGINPGKVDSKQVDKITFAHCQHILHLKDKGTPLDVNLGQIDDVLSSLSFVIIDEKELFFVMPSLKRDEQYKLQALELGTGVVLTDNDGSFVQEMIRLFNNLRMNANPIYMLDDKGTERSN